MSVRVTAALRAQGLAGDRRAGRWARSKAWSTQLAFVRRNWLVLATVLVGAGLIAVPAVWLAPDGFGRGFVAGSFPALVLSMLWLHVVRATGTGPTMMGDLAEQWSASELRHLRSRDWRVINGVYLGSDIDHVLVGPGGVIALETKWSAYSWAEPTGRERIDQAVAQVQRGARQLWLFTELRQCGVTRVDSVVLLWGEGAEDVHVKPPDTAGGAATVIAGANARAWAAARPTGVLDQDQVMQAWTVLDRHCRKRDDWTQGHAPAPRSPYDTALVSAATLSAAITGLFLAARCLSELGTLRWWALCLLVPLIAPGPVLERAARFRRLRPIAWGWSLGAATCVLLVAAMALYAAAG